MLVLCVLFILFAAFMFAWFVVDVLWEYIKMSRRANEQAKEMSQMRRAASGDSAAGDEWEG